MIRDDMHGGKDRNPEAAVVSPCGMPASDSISILTPLAFEARCLGVHGGWNVRICGPGSTGIESSWGADLPPSGSVVILAGTAGGLSPKISAGNPIVASEILDNATGRRWIPSMRLPATDCRSGLICSTGSIVSTVAQKRDLHRQTGADVVDLESAAFAALATDHSWDWAVIRGISDAADTALPIQSSRWITSSGRTRPMAVLASLVRNPGLISILQRLRLDSTAAMTAVQEAIEEIIQDHSS